MFVNNLNIMSGQSPILDLLTAPDQNKLLLNNSPEFQIDDAFVNEINRSFSTIKSLDGIKAELRSHNFSAFGVDLDKLRELTHLSINLKKMGCCYEVDLVLEQKFIFLKQFIDELDAHNLEKFYDSIKKQILEELAPARLDLSIYSLASKILGLKCKSKYLELLPLCYLLKNPEQRSSLLYLIGEGMINLYKESKIKNEELLQQIQQFANLIPDNFMKKIFFEINDSILNPDSPSSLTPNLSLTD